MSTEQNLVFQIIDDADCDQIRKFNSGVKSALVYQDKKGNREISYVGVQYMMQKAAEKGNAVAVEVVKYELLKHDINDKEQWFWHSIVRATNKRTSLETLGTSSCSYVEWINTEKGEKVAKGRDPFSDTIAMSKAERNALRKQIPIDELQHFVDTVDDKDVQQVGNNNNNSTPKVEAPTAKQINYARSLGWDWTIPAAKTIMSELVNDLVVKKIGWVKSQAKWKEYEHKNKKPTDNQLKKLKELGYAGETPHSETGAATLIEQLNKTVKSQETCTCVEASTPSQDTITVGEHKGCHICMTCELPIRQEVTTS